MKKVSLVVMDKERERSLEKLREVGVMHLIKRNVASEGLSKLLDKKAKIESAIGLLRPYLKAKQVQGEARKEEQDPVGRILALGDERKAAQEQLLFYTKERSRIEKWGDFEPASLKGLAEDGVVLIPYELSAKVHAALGEEQRFIVLARDKATVYGLALDREIPGEFPFALPEHSLGKIDRIIEGIKARLGEIEREFLALAACKERIDVESAELLQSVEFETAKAGMEVEDDTPAVLTVSWITGYAPQGAIGVLKRAAAENGWALIADDPAEDDRPPTLLRNNAFVRIIRPLFDFIGTVPGYWEYDISLSYLLFFCLFFAMIFGDAAYGSLMFIIVFFIGISYKKKSGKVPDAVKLFGLLSMCTIAWGSITGSWFATPVEKLPGFLRALIIPPFRSSGPLVEFPGFLQTVFHLPAEVPVDELKTRWNIEFLDRKSVV
jgi:V/A-type H+-transporting ATPase subunit I